MKNKKLLLLVILSFCIFTVFKLIQTAIISISSVSNLVLWSTKVLLVILASAFVGYAAGLTKRNLEAITLFIIFAGYMTVTGLSATSNGYPLPGITDSYLGVILSYGIVYLIIELLLVGIMLACIIIFSRASKSHYCKLTYVYTGILCAAYISDLLVMYGIIPYIHIPVFALSIYGSAYTISILANEFRSMNKTTT